MNAETKWTKGPWRVDAGTMSILSGSKMVIGCHGEGGWDYYFAVYNEPTEADAYLIAAAPELYEELAETHAALCLGDSNGMRDGNGMPYIGSKRWERNRAALAKARGEGRE